MNHPTSKVIHLTDASFDAEIGNSQLPVLVDFWAEWCGPCRMVGPVIEALASEYEGRARIAKVDVDNNQQISARLGIRSIPTVLLFQNGQIVDSLIGARSARDYQASLDKALAATSTA
jgi:thioredoxin 1